MEHLKSPKHENYTNEHSKVKTEVFIFHFLQRTECSLAFALTQHDIVINDVKLVTKEVSCCYSRDIILVAMVTRWLFCLSLRRLVITCLLVSLSRFRAKRKGRTTFIFLIDRKLMKSILIPISSQINHSLSRILKD